MKNRLKYFERCLIGLFLVIFCLIPATVYADTLPDSAYISGLIGHSQSYSLSCEARSAVDWAAFWGVNISETEFLANLPRSDNPDLGFVGNPNDPWGGLPPRSYGVHAAPVANLLQKYGLRAEAQRGLQWIDLKTEIAAGRPVIVWIIGQMWIGYPRNFTGSNGLTTIIAAFEHSMILIGYDKNTVQVVDAYSGQNQTYLLQTFLTSWSVLGNMALTGAGQPRQTSTPSSQTYTVQRGDYLVALATRFNTSWQELVALNNIPYPYTIFTGQILTLPIIVARSTPLPTPTPENLTVPILDPTETPVATPLPVEAVYVVQRGDYLTLIANRFGVDWQVLAQLNGLYFPFTLYTGQVLHLPVTNIVQTPSSEEFYVVQPGDYLASVAAQFSMDWTTLALLNGIGYPYVIYTGQVLRLR